MIKIFKNKIFLIGLMVVILLIGFMIIFKKINFSFLTSNNFSQNHYQASLNSKYASIIPSNLSKTILKQPTGSFNIVNFGASVNNPNNFQAIKRTILAAQKQNGLVFIPIGTYRLAGSLKISSKIILEGANEVKSVLMETKPTADLLSDQANGTIVQNITLNTQTYNGGHAFGTEASYTTLQNAIILSGSSPGHFALYYAGAPGASPHSPRYSQGNKLLNIVENDQICDDGISWSFQNNSSITNLNETGSRLAIYVDKNLTINNYVYHPGIQTVSCRNSPNGIPTQGFWVTPPSNNIVINNFNTYGNGGKFSSSANLYSSNITINNENFMNQAGYQMYIGDVRGLTIINSNFKNNKLIINPTIHAIINLKNSKINKLNLVSKSKINLSCQNIVSSTC